MIDIRIVCTHDAVTFAETLARLLGAEQHQVRVSYGRQSLHNLDAARALGEAVMLVWSYDAPSQHYMLEWARSIDPTRLVEVARAPGAPRLDRRAAVIDFANWRGERGARSWTALNDRLRAIARVLEPPKPPQKHAALALGLASVAAVGGAMFLRVNDTTQPMPGAGAQTAVIDAAMGVGGPLDAIEPSSVEDMLIVVRHLGGNLEPLDARDETPLPELAELSNLDIRDPTFMERLSALNPLRDPSPND
jgi:hypothetical protein